MRYLWILFLIGCSIGISNALQIPVEICKEKPNTTPILARLESLPFSEIGMELASNPKWACLDEVNDLILQRLVKLPLLLVELGIPEEEISISEMVAEIRLVHLNLMRDRWPTLDAKEHQRWLAWNDESAILVHLQSLENGDIIRELSLHPEWYWFSSVQKFLAQQ